VIGPGEYSPKERFSIAVEGIPASTEEAYAQILQVWDFVFSTPIGFLAGRL
jgi:hypothetical protein